MLCRLCDMLLLIEGICAIWSGKGIVGQNGMPIPLHHYSNLPTPAETSQRHSYDHKVQRIVDHYRY